MNFENWFTYI